MAGPTDNIEAIARAVCQKSLAHQGKSEEELAAEVEMYWHVVASYLEAGVMDESGREIGELSWDEKLDITGDWLRRHPETAAAWRMARFGSPLPRT